MAVVQRLNCPEEYKANKIEKLPLAFLDCVFISLVGLQGRERLSGLGFVHDAVDFESLVQNELLLLFKVLDIFKAVEWVLFY